ncbi:potassium transporter TrkG [Roseicyclus sp. F158]|uniref:Potassium transporter TrkG n=1 Tax=Tropicimonas omnivorans TaxID=3075590 RepID=A0ABU3DGR0_9RHOB|nr:potassium transporter TrkG [Roseicyclus sp. F158]MDT0682879.1 potassium transporter TrkG [Roseicyclus sp. F158]
MRVPRLPLIVVLSGIASLAMFLPVFHAAAVEDAQSARAFLLGGAFGLIGTTLLGLATSAAPVRNVSRSHLLTLVAAYTILPIYLALPVQAAAGVSLPDAWFEMVSSLTTTGATLWRPLALPDTVHLWRATVGWLGGFLIWVAAFGLLAPMNLGGFEVTSTLRAGAGARADRISAEEADRRLYRVAETLAPIYAGLTGVLWLALAIAGERPLTAICHAMSTLATSGISPTGGTAASVSGIPGEMIIFVFLVFGVSRATFWTEGRLPTWERLSNDPELRMATACVTLVPVLLFLRHWIGAYEGRLEADLGSAIGALWGSIFSLLSFLTTTGFVSAEWDTARWWSGLQSPGLILLAAALVGGGVATTAGGVKLLRVFALYKHGVREMERLVHPHSIGGAGREARRIRRQGAFIAWIFFMLFAISLAVCSGLLAATGMSFDEAMVLSVAALSSTGPLVGVIQQPEYSFALLTDWGKAIAAVAMVVGRMETLAIIALFNPEFWRG